MIHRAVTGACLAPSLTLSFYFFCFVCVCVFVCLFVCLSVCLFWSIKTIISGRRLINRGLVRFEINWETKVYLTEAAVFGCSVTFGHWASLFYHSGECGRVGAPLIGLLSPWGPKARKQGNGFSVFVVFISGMEYTPLCFIAVFSSRLPPPHA